MPPEAPIVIGLSDPLYPNDPGTGVEIFVHSNEVYIAMFWDGACRSLLHLTPEELDAIYAAAKAP